MSTPGERKCALLLLTLRRSDRRRLLRRLPTASANTVRALIAELEALPLPITELADALLADEVMGLTAQTTPAFEQLVGLSRQVSPVWFARVLSVWGGVDRAFCLSMLDEKTAAAIRRESIGALDLPPRLADAMRVEARALTQAGAA